MTDQKRVERVASAIGAAMITRRSTTEIAESALRAAGHDPDENCTCHPDDLMGEGICEYRMLADSAGEAFNPPDDDEAEVAVLVRAIERAAGFIGSLPCTCPQGDHRPWAGDEPCGRCAALGQFRGKPVNR
jgi:hypothetical protein